MRKRDLVAAAAGAVAATALAGGVAWAAIPGDGNVYTACMLKNVGTVRLIDKSLPPSNLMSRCKPALETEISWNQQGPQGIQGPGKGDVGPTGQPGPQGERGLQGEQGIQGPKGDKGDQGEQGLQGPPGSGGGSGACSTATVNGGTNGVADFGYASLVRQASPNFNVDANADTFMCVGRLSNLILTSSVAPGVGYLLRVFINGGDTLLRCDIRGDETTCTNTADTLDVNPGDEISVRVSRSPDTPVASFTWSATVRPPVFAYP